MYLLLLFLFYGVSGNKICYNGIECLYYNKTWLVDPTPKSPQDLNVKIYFKNRFLDRIELPSNNDSLPHMIYDDYLINDHFTMIVHGFMSSANESWVQNLEKALVQNVDTNVFTVDWSKGTKGPNYFQAVSNIKTVSAIIVRFLKEQIDKKTTTAQKVHLIGQSLGAHLVSSVANKIHGIGHLTGLDPAQPGFSRTSRLDQNSIYVEVVHTNTARILMSLSIGHNDPLGDVDFYINGGWKQPDCPPEHKIMSYLTSKFEELTCHHMKAQEYYIESLKCNFIGIKWDRNTSNIPDRNIKCTIDNCQIMGLNGKNLPGRGVFYVHTNKKPPYCDSKMMFYDSFSLMSNVYKGSKLK